MSTVEPSWEPSRHPVHRLIQIIDVLAIALNRYVELRRLLPERHEPEYRRKKQALEDEYTALHNLSFPVADKSHEATAERLTTAALAELARCGSVDETAIQNTHEWLTALGRRYFPKFVEKPSASLESCSGFDFNGQPLDHYFDVRKGLVIALARVGQTIPDEIVQRKALAFGEWNTATGQPVTQEKLIGWLMQTDSTLSSTQVDGNSKTHDGRAVVLSEYAPQTEARGCAAADLRLDADRPRDRAGVKKGPRLTKAEAEIRVRDWLLEHAKADPFGVTRDRVAKETGVSAGMVSNTNAWKAFQQERRARKKVGERAIPLTDQMVAHIQADCGAPDELAALIEEQAREQAEEERRHKPRHKSS